MKYTVLFIAFGLAQLSAKAQFDSLAVDIFVQSPTSGQDFDLARTFGVKLGKVNSHHKFALGYSSFQTTNTWSQFYNEQTNRWTDNPFVLHDYSESMPAQARNGKVATQSHGIHLGWSREPAVGTFSLYTAINFTAFINQINQNESAAEAFFTQNLGASSSVPQGTSIDETFIGYTNVETTSDTRYTSVVPSLSIATGAVFRLGDKLKLIPLINVGAYIRDQRIYTGTLNERGNALYANVRAAAHLSYTLQK